MTFPLHRRQFLSRTGGTLGAVAAGLTSGCIKAPEGTLTSLPHDEDTGPLSTKNYVGPNVIVVRFGGGVRRLETVVSPEKTFCPFIYHELAGKQGVLFRNIEIANAPGVVTSHGQGTLYLLTGRYDKYEDISNKPLAERFEPKVPTLFEYLRRSYQIPAHQALIINGEDRINEEFYTFSNHHLFGVQYKATVLSLYRFKSHILRRDLAEAKLTDAERKVKEQKLAEMESKDYRPKGAEVSTPELDVFWDRWAGYYGRDGMVNPRGDRLLTELSLWALRELRPKLLLINYQDPDYVHWGDPQFYTRAVTIIDEGVRQLYEATQVHEEYRDNTVFVVVPDCGRDSNRAMAVPFQHHFNTRSAHEIFAVVAGPKTWVPRARPVTRTMPQIGVAATVGEIMGFRATQADAESLYRVV